MPPKPKQSKDEPDYNPSGHHSRRTNPAVSYDDCDSIEEISEELRVQVRRMQIGERAFLDVAFHILDTNGVTPAQAFRFAKKSELMIKNSDPSAGEISELSIAIGYEFYDELTSSKAWKLEPKENDQFHVEFQDTSSDSDSESATETISCLASCTKKSTFRDIRQKSDDKDVKNLLKRTIKNIKRKRDDAEKNSVVTPRQVMDRLYNETCIGANRYSETLVDFSEKALSPSRLKLYSPTSDPTSDLPTFAFHAAEDLNTSEVIEMRKEKGLEISPNGLEELRYIVTCPRLLNVMIKLVLICLPNLPKEDQDDVIDILLLREKPKINEDRIPSKSQSLTESIGDIKKDIRAQIERNQSADNTMHDALELPSFQIDSKADAKFCSTSDIKAVSLNEGGKDTEDSTDIEDDIVTEADSISEIESVSTPSADDIIAEAAPQPNELESELSSPSNGFSTRDLSPMPLESPGKEVNK